MIIIGEISVGMQMFHMNLKINEEGYTTFQIHDFMNVFGEHAHIGAKPFLETYDVLIERSK